MNDTFTLLVTSDRKRSFDLRRVRRGGAVATPSSSLIELTLIRRGAGTQEP